MEHKKLLETAGIAPEKWDSCFVTENEEIFRPQYKNEQIVKTAKEIYDEWLHEKQNPPPVPPDPLNVLGAQVAQLSIDNMKKDQIINALGAQLAQTSLDVMALKNGGV